MVISAETELVGEGILLVEKVVNDWEGSVEGSQRPRPHVRCNALVALGLLRGVDGRRLFSPPNPLSIGYSSTSAAAETMSYLS